MGDHQTHLNGFIYPFFYFLGLATTFNEHIDLFVEILQNFLSEIVHFVHVD
jgi:hypothetical protein